MRVTNIDEIYQQLAEYIDDTASLLQDYSLERIHNLMDFLGNPQDRINVVHIAGTSGKTSTCYYLAEMLRLSGIKVGLSVSPEIDTVAERVQVNGKVLPEKVFCGYLNEFLVLVEDSCIRTSYWEFMTAFSFWVFAEKEQVGVAVIETGLGGLLDASNIVNNPSKICVITDIGLDHQAILGDTLGEIAEQKAGIIQINNQVLMFSQGKEVDSVVKTRAKAMNAKLNLLVPEKVMSEAPNYAKSMPEFQIRNWCLARVAYDLVVKNSKLARLARGDLKETTKLYIPARMDSKIIGSKTVIMDGAHNAQKMTAFVSSFMSKYPGSKVPVIIALKDDKDSIEVLTILKPIVSKLIITEFDVSNDLMKSSINPDSLAASAESLGYRDLEVIINRDDALAEGLGSDSEMLIVTGSFYLIGQLRKNMNNKFS